MKKLLAVVVLFAGSCAGPRIPDDLPPAPPARTGERITAPSTEPEASGAEEDGFGGGDGFGGEEVTIDVEAAESEEEAAKTTEEKKKDDAEVSKAEDDKEEPTTQPSEGEPKQE